MSTIALVSRWFSRLRVPSLRRAGSAARASRRKRQAWIDLVHSSAHLQRDLGLIDAAPGKRGR